MFGAGVNIDLARLKLGSGSGSPSIAPIPLLARRLARRARTRGARAGVVVAVLVLLLAAALLATALLAFAGVLRCALWPPTSLATTTTGGGLDPDLARDRARIGPVYDEVVRARQSWADVMHDDESGEAEAKAELSQRGNADAGNASAAAAAAAAAAATAPLLRWEDIMHDVAVIIKTGHEVAENRLKQLRTIGWMSLGRPVPNLLVVSDRSGTGVVGMKIYAQNVLAEHVARMNATATVPDKWFSQNGWRGDKDKNLPAFHLAHKVYPDKKWYVLLDDDTYIFLDNFASFTGRHSSPEEMARPLYTGKVFYASHCGPYDKDGFHKNSRGLPRLTFAHGGSGIVINAATLNAMYPSIPECVTKYSSCWAGDIQVAFCLNDLGIRSKQYNDGKGYEKHFTPFAPSLSLADQRYAARWQTTEQPITFHQVPLHELSLLSQFDAMCRREHTNVVYSKLLRHLTSNGLKFPFAAHK